MKNKNLIFIQITVLLLIFPVFLFASTFSLTQGQYNEGISIASNGDIYWVEAGENGDGTSESNPAGNITYIIDNYGSDNMVIKVKPGIYNDTIEDLFPIEFNFGNNVTLESTDGAEETIIKSDGSNIFYINRDTITIKGFTIANSSNNAIQVNSVEDLTIEDNIITNNSNGIYIINSILCNFSFNNISSNNGMGITTNNVNYSYFDNNEFFFNGDHGLNMQLDSFKNKIINNIIKGNGQIGIYLRDGRENDLLNNILEGNEGYGMWLEYTNQTEIKSNIISNHWNDGIHLVNSNNNSIVKNNITVNGIVNTEYGINIDSESSANCFYKNNFVDNNIHVITSLDNNFNSSIVGNYWDNYTGEDTDGNGIGETPHLVDPDCSCYDYLPVVNPIDIRDISAPDLYMLTPDTGYVEKADFSANWEISEPYSNMDHFGVKLDNQDWIYTIDSIYDFYDVNSGDHTIEVRAVDKGWNIASVIVNFEVDTTPPDIIINNPSNITYYTTEIYINTTVRDTQAGIFSVIAEVNGMHNVTLSLEGYDTYMFLYQNFTVGKNSIKIYAEDVLENLANSDTVYFTVSSEPPEGNGIPGFDISILILSISTLSIISIWWMRKSQDFNK